MNELKIIIEFIGFYIEYMTYSLIRRLKKYT